MSSSTIGGQHDRGPTFGTGRQAIGRAHARSAAQVALNWLARQPGVLPIPGAKNARQAADNARAIDFEISESEAIRLDEVSRR